jgi:hypothetical protein
MHQKYPDRVKAFVTHSTGLKVRKSAPAAAAAVLLVFVRCGVCLCE